MKCALLIGINYTGTKCELKGCVNDIYDIYNLCLKNNYKFFKILCDDNIPIDNTRNVIIKPTKQNIITAIRTFITNSFNGDTLYIHYSGHGSQVESLSGAEIDCLDEAIIPLDYKTNGIITDDELRNLIVVPLLNKKIKVRIVFDCCHSGTALDLKHNLMIRDSMFPNSKTINLSKNIENNNEISFINQMVKEQIAKEMKKYIDNNIVDKYMETNNASNNGSDNTNTINTNNEIEIIESVNNEKYLISNKIFNNRINNVNDVNLDIILLSGCYDNQTSMDASFNNRFNGALTNNLIKLYNKYMTMQNIPNIISFLQDIRNEIKKGKFEQIPQISSESQFTNYRCFDL